MGRPAHHLVLLVLVLVLLRHRRRARHGRLPFHRSEVRAAGAARAEPPPGGPTGAGATEIDRLATADSAYTSGALTAAAYHFIEAFLAANPDGDGADRALLQLGLLYTLPDSSVADPTRGRARLHTLVQRFPVSPYSPQARSILALMDEMDRLRGDLQRQKKAAEELERSSRAQAH